MSDLCLAYWSIIALTGYMLYLLINLLVSLFQDI